MEPISLMFEKIITPENSVGIINLAILIYLLFQKVSKKDDAIIRKISDINKLIADESQKTHDTIKDIKTTINDNNTFIKDIRENTNILKSSDIRNHIYDIKEMKGDIESQFDKIHELHLEIESLEYKLNNLDLNIDKDMSSLKESYKDIYQNISKILSILDNNLNVLIRDIESLKYTVVRREVK
ncbi:MAG: hypothetical protein ACPLX8_00140 [Nanopusillaceae archaeon]